MEKNSDIYVYVRKPKHLWFQKNIVALEIDYGRKFCNMKDFRTKQKALRFIDGVFTRYPEIMEICLVRYYKKSRKIYNEVFTRRK